MVLDFRKSIAFWKISKRRPFVLRVQQSVDKDEYGVLVEWYRQGKAEVLWENAVPVSLLPVQISYGLTWDRTRELAGRAQRLTLKEGTGLQVKRLPHNKHFGSPQKTLRSKICKEITQGCTKFSKPTSRLKILGAIRAIWSKFQIENRKILNATINVLSSQGPGARDLFSPEIRNFVLLRESFKTIKYTLWAKCSV